MKKQNVLELRDRDGVMPFTAEAFKDAVSDTREYIRFLLDELSKDYELRVHSLLNALYPLNWIIEQAVITDTEKGGAA